MTSGELFKRVWKGWFVGASIIFAPLFLLSALLRPDAPPSMALAVLGVPAITAFQGVIIAGIVVLGAKIWPVKSNGYRKSSKR